MEDTPGMPVAGPDPAPMSEGPAAARPARARHDLGAVYDDLRRRIIHLDLAPGARLREQSLADEYGISRTPIRRILDRLAHEGLVTIHPGSGASVSVVDFGALREVWALRLKIAELVADFVRLPAPPEIRDRLRELLRRLDAIGEDGELAQLYDDYHAVMLDVMTNGPLRSIYDQLYAQTARVFVQLLPRLDVDVEIEAIRDEITLTLEACTQRSGHRLAEVRTEHMHMLLTRVNRVLTLGPTGPPPTHEEATT
jgi:DNA-binding GntR family transcriptional regulator